MKKIIFLLAVTVITAQNLRAQDTTTRTVADSTLNFKNSWYIEFLGSSLLGITFNYERFLSKTPGGLSVHAGFGGGIIPHIFTSGADFYGTLNGGVSYNIPVTANKRGMIEIGGVYGWYSGAVLSQFGDDSIISADAPAGLLSWRHQSVKGNTQIRATIMTFVEPGGRLQPWIGFSVGQRF
ncbi:MAG: hypothetical protein ACHQF4_08830 [Sphingobacteriales bacterium]